MNAKSEPIGHSLRHLTKYVLIYPLGVVPPWLPEGYQPEECIEDYEMAFSSQAPVIGHTRKGNGQAWTITQVQTYRSLESSDAVIEGFHVAICTQDGCLPNRNSWHSSKSPLLVIHTLSNGELATNEDGSCHYELVAREDWITPFQGWEIQTLQHFEPVGDRLPGDHDKVIVAWSLCTVGLDGHSGPKAA